MIQSKKFPAPGASSPPSRVLLTFCLVLLVVFKISAQTSNTAQAVSTKRVLMIFSEARDLPGNTLMEQAARQEILAHTTNNIEFFSESLDASHFPGPALYQVFADYIRNKYSSQNLNLILMFMARNLTLAHELNFALNTNIPSVFVVLNDMEFPGRPIGRPFTGIIERSDVRGTINFLFRLQPETRRVVVIGGASATDRKTLARIAQLARTVDGVKFIFWTNQPVAELCRAARGLKAGTVILLGPVERDSIGRRYYTSEVAQLLAPAAAVPVYVLGEGAIGSGALGGSVLDLDRLGQDAGKLALSVLNGDSASQIPIQVHAIGTPMVDWRALRRWDIKDSRLPAGCVVRYQPHSLWEGHRTLIVVVAAGLMAQALTIVALLAQRARHRRAQAQIERQRAELAHVSRLSTVGQLTSALTHELNQPLGAILRNAEAAELFLQDNPPNLDEVRAILTDIRRDDKRAGNVIDRMRALYQRRSLALAPLDLCELVADTIALTRADAAARHVKVQADLPQQLPAARADRVHLQQVLLNLILNGMDAMTATPKAGRLLNVRVSQTKNGNLQVAVTDRGIGIAPKDADRIFEPFFTTKINGMGMGLAISQTIIEAHGGEIWVDSQGVRGTTFTFILPPAGLPKVKDGDLPENI